MYKLTLFKDSFVFIRMLKFSKIYIILLLALQSCVANSVMSFEDDDVYFVKKDIVSKEEWEEYLQEKKGDFMEEYEENQPLPIDEK